MDVGVVFTLIGEQAAKNPVLLICLLLGIGSLIGGFRVRGIGLGPAAVLFLAIAFSAANANLMLPAIVGNVGLALFAYTIGLSAGPSFFATLRKGSKMVMFTVAALVAAGGVTVGLGHLFNLNKDILAGIYAGSLTNTPALAAANEQIAGEGPIVGYSITYIFGVICMMVVATFAARRKDSADDNEELVPETRNVRVETSGLPALAVLADRYDHPVVFSRISRGTTPGHEGVVELAVDSTVPEPGDILTVVTDSVTIEKVVNDIGHSSAVALQLDRSTLDFRRVTMSNSSLSGRRINELNLERHYGVTITRVRRGDVDIVAEENLALLTGDRVRIVGPPGKVAAAAEHLGDSEIRSAHINATSLGLGMSLGVLLGLLIWPLPGGSHFAFGVAGGCLIVGLLLGRAMRTGPFVWSLPYSTTATLNQLGLLLFLAYAGSTAGPAFVKAVHSDQLVPILVTGVLVVVGFMVAVLLFGRYVVKLSAATLAGTVAGAGTQPVVLAHANSLVNSANVNLGYALVYPAAMIVKVIVAPFIGTLF